MKADLMRGVAAVSLVLSVLGASSAVARNEVFYFPIKPVLESADYQTRIGDGVRFFFGDRMPPGFASVTGEEGAVGDGAVHFHDRSEQDTCNDAFLDALADLKGHASSGAAIVNITSYFRRRTYSSPDQYECHIGLTGAKVTLRGFVSKPAS